MTKSTDMPRNDQIDDDAEPPLKTKRPANRRIGGKPGRPKGSRNRKTILREVAGEMHHVDIVGMPSRLSTFELIMLMIRNLAMNGNAKAGRWSDELLERHGNRSSDKIGGYLIVPEDLSSDEFVADARERNAQLDRDIEASGAKSFIEYLDMRSKRANSME